MYVFLNYHQIFPLSVILVMNARVCWVGSGNELCQFLRIFLLTVLRAVVDITTMQLLSRGKQVLRPWM